MDLWKFAVKVIVLSAYKIFYCPTSAKVRNDKARKYLTCMRKKQPASFSQKFPKADPLALRLLRRLLAFDPKDRPSAEEVCDIYELNWSHVLHLAVQDIVILIYLQIVGIGRSIL